MQTPSLIVPEQSGFDELFLSLLIPLEELETPNSLRLSPPSRAPVQTVTTESLMGTPVIGQYFDQDFFGSSGQIFSNFVESGQIWALLIGLVLGYLIRGLTTY
jgi:hypothetical protein